MNNKVTINSELLSDDLWWYDSGYLNGTGTAHQISYEEPSLEVIILDKDGQPFYKKEKFKIGFV